MKKIILILSLVILIGSFIHPVYATIATGWQATTSTSTQTFPALNGSGLQISVRAASFIGTTSTSTFAGGVVAPCFATSLNGACITSGSGGTPGGNDGDIQYKSGSSFAGTDNAILDSNGQMTIGIAGNLNLFDGVDFNINIGHGDGSYPFTINDGGINSPVFNLSATDGSANFASGQLSIDSSGNVSSGNISAGGGDLIIDRTGAYGSNGGYYFRNLGNDAGLVLEGTDVLSMANNVLQVGTRDTSKAGMIFREDSRVGIGGTNGGEQSFIVFGSPTGGSAFNNIFAVSAQTGETLLNAFSGNTAIGDTTATTGKLHIKSGGTTTGITFQTINSASAVKFTILDNGNVGIGSSTPSTPLVVVGTSTLNNIIPSGPYTGNMSTFAIGASTTRWSSLWAQTVNIGTSTWSLGQTGTRFGVFNQALATGTEALSITIGGNVGIGSTTPGSLLSVNGTTTATCFTTTTAPSTCITSGGGTNFFTNSGASTTLSTGTNLISSQATFGSITATGTISVSNNQSLQFADSSGNASAFSLKMDGSNNAIVNANGAFGALKIQSNSGAITLDSGSGASLTVANGGNTTVNGGTFLKSNGFVGLGTSSPSNQLEVSGDSFVSGNSTSTTFGIPAGGTINYNGNILAYASTTKGNYFFGNAGNLTGTSSSNTGVGNVALSNLTSGGGLTGSNTALGAVTLTYLTTGGANTGVGSGAGSPGVGIDNRSVTDNFMTFIGFQASRDGNIVSSSTQLTNSTAIGQNARVGCSNCLILGGTGVSSENVGIGTTTPVAKVEIINVLGSSTDLINISTTTASNVFSSAFKVTAAGRIGISSSSPVYTLSASGTVGFTNIGSATNLDAVCRNLTTGQIFDSGGITCQLSSIFFKKDIKDMTDEEVIHDIQGLRAITYTSKTDESKNVGFIAEEVEKVDPRLVDHAAADETVDGHFFKKGDPVGVNYGNITAILIKYEQDFSGGNSKNSSSKWPWVAIVILGAGFIYQQIKINTIKK